MTDLHLPHEPKKIALIRPNYPAHFISPQLGLGYLSAWLKQHGYQPLLIDALRDGLSHERVAKILRAQNIGIAGLTCLSSYYGEVVELARMLKERGVRVIIGGVHPSFLPWQTLTDSGADFVVCGEGELALLALLEGGLTGEQDGARIRGVHSLQDLHGPDEPFDKADIINNLDDLPFPDWEQMPPASFPLAPHGVLVNRFPIGAIMSSRGCPHACKFCSSTNFYEKRIRFRSPENVVAEMRLLKDQFGVREFQFSDDNLTMKKSHVEKICTLMLEQNINASWSCPNGVRADRMDDETAALMRQAGCYYCGLGIESADDAILRNINKRESVATIRQAISIIRRNGIECGGFFILGLPGETRATLEKTIRFALETGLDRAQFFLLSVLPGCEFWDELKGRFDRNFSRSIFKGVEYIPDGLTHEELLAAQGRAFRQFYLRPRILLTMLRYIKLRQARFFLDRLLDYGVFFRRKNRTAES